MKPLILNKHLKLAVLLLFAFGLTNFAVAQRTISGTVTDAESGEPLIGANILVVGTSTGTASDIDGSYSVNVPEGASVLEFSYTGYTSQRITIGASDVIDIEMTSGDFLDEVVVVGYGSVRKTDATGAVASLTSDDFNPGVISSPEQLIQGRAAGVQITSASGEPGAGINIRIRGTSSVRSGNNPLIVVDGVPLSGGDVSGSGASQEQHGSGHVVRGAQPIGRNTLFDFLFHRVAQGVGHGTFDKAGSYAIQNEVFHPVARIDGSYNNVVGLPIETVAAVLRRWQVL